MRGLRRVVPFAIVVGAGLVLAGGLPGAARAACAPMYRETTVSQGLPYTVLARGKETLVRVYLSLPAACTDGAAVTSASLKVDVASAAAPATVLSSTTVQPTPGYAAPFPKVDRVYAVPFVAAAMTAYDPVFIVPGAVLAPGTTGRLSVTFTPSITYDGANAPVVLPATVKTVEARTNALRILVVPLAQPLDVSSSQNVQNAMTTLSRLYPVPDGTPSGARVGSLTGTDGGIRWNLNNGFVNWAAFNPAIPLPLCGNTGNSPQIRDQLAQFRTSWNAANPNAQADRVLGAINDTLLDKTSGCALGMASTSSPEGWVTASGIAGALAGMEMGHTFGLVPPARSSTWHTLRKNADYGADKSRAFNVQTRQFLSDARSVMGYSAPGWTNDNTLFEQLDWANVLCQLGGAVAGGCTAAQVGTVGTPVGVAAAAPDPAFNINASTDGTPAGTHVVESFVAPTYPTPPADPASLYRLVQLNAAGLQLRSDPVTASNVESIHSTDVPNHGIDESATQLISASIPLSLGATDVRLMKGAVVLYDATNTGTPVVSSASVVSGAGITVAPGGTLSFERSVPTAAIPARPDVYFLADTTGSMGPSLQSVKDKITEITGLVEGGSTDSRFGAGNYRDFESGVDQPFTDNSSITAAAPATDPHLAGVTATAVGNWQAAGGGDTPEAQLYALHRVAQPGFFRSGTTRVLVWFGDNPGHDPICSGLDSLTSDLTEASVTQELVAAKIRVIAVTVNSGRASSGLNGNPLVGNGSVYTCTQNGTAGQADRIAAATGGIVESAASASDVANAITAGLQSLPVAVTPHADCEAGGGISVTFDPANRSVTSGTTAAFTETVHANEAAPGSHSCTVYYTVGDSSTPVDSHTVTILISSLTVPHDLITWTVTGSPAATVKSDVVVNCSGVRNVIAVALTTTSLDTPVGCPGGTYEILANDGFTQTPPTAAGPTSVVTTAAAPVAAIASPLPNAVVGQHELVALHGSGYDYAANRPIPPSGLQWSLDGNPVGAGPTVDLPGVAIGSHTVKLAVTDSTGATGETTVSFTSTDDADGDRIKLADELRIGACAPPGSPAPDSDPTNGAKDYDHDGIPNRDDLNTPNGPCVAETLYEARGIILPNPLDLNRSAPTLTAGAIVLPERDLRQVIGSTIQIVSVNGIPIPGGIHALVWGAIGQVGGAVFPRAPLVSFLRAHGLVNTKVVLRAEASAGSWSFFVLADLNVIG